MDILDDARVARITEKQRAFFSAGNTLPLRFRQEQLAKLKSAVLAREERFADALAKEHYKNLALHAQDCICCGHCDRRCPFGVHQSARMKEIAAYFGL